ncbi:MAG: hypothetical protein ACRYFX_06340 [Janthinobacterium lividum]
MNNFSSLRTRAKQLLLALLLLPLASRAQVGVGTTTPDASAALDVSSTSGGILLPRMTAAQRAAIASPAPGLLVFQTDGTPGFYYYSGSFWVNLITNIVPNATEAAGVAPTVQVTTLAGGNSSSTDGLGTAAGFSVPLGVAIDPSGAALYVADRFNNRIRKVDLTPGTTTYGNVTTLAGSTAGTADGLGTAAQFSNPAGVAMAPGGAALYVADAGNYRIRRVDLTSGATYGNVTTLAGSTSGYADGLGTAAKFAYPSGIVADPSGTALYVADANNNRIRKVDLTSGATTYGNVTTLAGSTSGTADGLGTAAQFNSPNGVAVTSGGVALYVADVNNSRIRKVDLASGATYGNVTTLAGSTAGYIDGLGTAAKLASPSGVVIDPSGTALYVTDTSNNRIRKVDLTGGVTYGNVTTLAGSGTGNADGTAPVAGINSPNGITASANGTIYVTDSNSRIRVLK